MPVLFRKPPRATLVVRNAGSTNRRRFSSSVDHAGCRPFFCPERPSPCRFRFNCRPSDCDWPEYATSFSCRDAENFSASISSRSSASSTTISSVTGVCSAIPLSRPRRSTSSRTAATSAHGLPARPSGLVQRLSRIMPPRLFAESSRKTSWFVPSSLESVAWTWPTRGQTTFSGTRCRARLRSRGSKR